MPNVLQVDGGRAVRMLRDVDRHVGAAAQFAGLRLRRGKSRDVRGHRAQCAEAGDRRISQPLAVFKNGRRTVVWPRRAAATNLASARC